jgi:hypothetical protein
MRTRVSCGTPCTVVSSPCVGAKLLRRHNTIAMFGSTPGGLRTLAPEPGPGWLNGCPGGRFRASEYG